jgi:signal peptidase I
MEWLANLSIQWVLVAIGLLVIGRAILVRLGTAGPQSPSMAVAAVLEFIDAALAALAIVFLFIRPFFIQAYFIPSESMHPTLLESDRIVVNKLLYRFRSPHRGELLVFRPPPSPRIPDATKDYIKRVIGLPGETVEIVPQRLLIDGKTLMRLTRQPASDLRQEAYPPNANLGFTFPLEGGSARVDDGMARISPGLAQELKVLVYHPGDVAWQDGNYVYVNGKPALASAFGPLEESHDLTQWGGDDQVVGTVFAVNGTPRLVLVQGNKLTLDPGHVRIDGRRLEEGYLAEEILYPMPPVRLPAGVYFMLGDNRNHSLDSHVWGPLPRDRIIGRAEGIFWPPRRCRWLLR